MELQDFFTQIQAPKFIVKYFEQPDWYLLVGKFKEILQHELTKTVSHSKNETLKVYGKIYLGKNCRIGDYVVIEGPAYIGDNVEIGPGAYIRPGSIISNDCVVGHAAEIKNSLLMAGAKTSNHNFVGDSIVGAKARFGGHCETTNRRFDQQPIFISYKNEKLATGLDKYGLILGQEARLGGSVLTAPGTTIGKRTFVSTGLSIGGFIPAGKFVKVKQELLLTDNNFQGELHNRSRLFEH